MRAAEQGPAYLSSASRVELRRGVEPLEALFCRPRCFSLLALQMDPLVQVLMRLPAETLARLSGTCRFLRWLQAGQEGSEARASPVKEMLC